MEWSLPLLRGNIAVGTVCRHSVPGKLSYCIIVLIIFNAGITVKTGVSS